MSLIDAPMALIDRILARRAHAVQPDDPVARLVARTTGRLRPDPAYQRRLRSQVVNQYVAMREGLVEAPARRREMGRLGRAVLYATFGVAFSVSAVAAASTSSLPGDALYPVKRQIEELRMTIAPSSVRPGLVAMALEERLSEVERLAAAGRWSLVADASEQADAAELRLVAMGGPLTKGEEASLSRHVQVLTSLLASAPAAAQQGLQHAIAVSSGNHGTSAGSQGGTLQGSQGSGSQGGHAGQPQGQPAHSPKPTASPDASRSPHPTPSQPAPPEATPAAHPTHSPGQNGKTP